MPITLRVGKYPTFRTFLTNEPSYEAARLILLHRQTSIYLSSLVAHSDLIQQHSISPHCVFLVTTNFKN